MSTSQNTARTKSGGGAVDLDSYLWPDTGIEPSDTANAAYEAYKEPVAGLDNDANYGITWDLGALNYETGALIDRVDDLEAELDALRNDLTDLENSFSSHNHDARYYQKTNADDRFVNELGDTMTGVLAFDSAGTTDGYLNASGETSTYSQVVQDGFGRASHYWNVEPGTQNVITENEGAAWWFMDGGTMHLDLYDGTTGDAGSPPDWTRIIDASTDGVTLSTGAALGGALDAQSNNVEGVNVLRFRASANDPIKFEDGSGGANTTPYTMRYNDRNLRAWSGQIGGAAMEWGLDGSVQIPSGPLDFDQQASRINLGMDNAGPHMLAFGNDDSSGGLRLVMRMSPNNLNVEKPDGSTLWYTDQDGETVDFGGTNYVVLPVRGGAPSNPPSGATWLET